MQIIKRYDAFEILMLTASVLFVVAIAFVLWRGKPVLQFPAWLPPKVLEAGSRQFGVLHGMLDCGRAGYAKLYLGSDEEAAAWLHRAIETNRSYSLQHFALACALAHLGQLDDARAAVHAGLALNPTFTLRRFRAGTSSNNPTFLAQRERIYDGMRKAGVPEG